MTTELRAEIFSFGYKYGPPAEVNLLWDLRFLPNPYWVEELRGKTGLDPAVADYVLHSATGTEFLKHVEPLLLFLVRQYAASAHPLRIAVGCTGGRHRSVAVTERLAELITLAGYTILTSHRDIDRDGG